MSEFYSFYFNGQKYYTNQPINLKELLNYFNYKTSLFVIEYNNFFCNKNE